MSYFTGLFVACSAFVFVAPPFNWVESHSVSTTVLSDNLIFQITLHGTLIPSTVNLYVPEKSAPKFVATAGSISWMYV